jgi:hypothetical protein
LWSYVAELNATMGRCCLASNFQAHNLFFRAEHFIIKL